MNHKSYKHIITVFALCFLGTTFAQKFDKKFTESFKVNKDVEVAINASNTEINVTTWNKNEVQVQAFIEIEGLSKKDAEKYFEEWNFEALGNKSKVKITAKGNNSFHFKNDFIMFNDTDFTFPDIEMPNIETIVIPEMDFDFDFDFENIFEDLIGEEGTTDADQFGSYSEEFCVDATDLELNLWTQTWSNDESLDITNIMILCYEKDLTLSTNSPICQGEELDLEATSTVPSIDSYEWTSNGGSTIADPSSPITTATDVTDGEEFTMTVTDDGCMWDETITVEVNSTPTISITGPSLLCEGECGTITLTITDGTGDYDVEFTWMGIPWAQCHGPQQPRLNAPSLTNGATC